MMPMKVVAISLDPQVLNSKSVASTRNRLYGEITDEYRVVVHSKKDSILELAPNVTIYGVGGRYKFIRLIRISLLLRKLVREEKCNVITSSDPYFFSLVAYCVASLYHIGFEAHILGIEKLNPLRLALARFFVKRASTVRVNSTRLRDRVSKEFGVEWDKIAFVPIYVPTEHLFLHSVALDPEERKGQEELQSLFSTTYKETFNILFAGRLVPVKNVPMQLRALSVLLKKCPEARLHIAGEGTDERTLRALAEELGVKEQTIFHGRKTGASLGTLYRFCDTFILTSFAEGWPMVIFEAMTAGLPIVMTDVGCAGEMIKNEENGLVVPVDDAQALGDALYRLITEPGLKERLSEASRIHIQNYWTRDQILAGYRQSWEKALANKL